MTQYSPNFFWKKEALLIFKKLEYQIDTILGWLEGVRIRNSSFY